MIDHHFVLLGAVFNVIGAFSYVRDTLRGITKPNRVTWFLWALAPLIAFSAELKAGVGLQSLMTFMVGFGPALIFIASFVNRKSYWKLTRFDIFCGLMSVLALVLWKITGTRAVAITLLTLDHWTLALAGFPVYILLVCLLMYSLGKYNRLFHKMWYAK